MLPRTAWCSVFTVRRCREALDAFGAAAAGAVQGQPVARRCAAIAGLQRGTPSGVGVGSGHVGDEQTTEIGRYLLISAKSLLTDAGIVLLGQKGQQAQASIVVVVAGTRSGWETTGDQMRAVAGRCSVIGCSLDGRHRPGLHGDIKSSTSGALPACRVAWGKPRQRGKYPCPIVIGEGEYRYEVIENWGTPAGWLVDMARSRRSAWTAGTTSTCSVAASTR